MPSPAPGLRWGGEKVCWPRCRAALWCQVREWLSRRAGVRGVSWPRWRQSRSRLPSRARHGGLRTLPGVGLKAGEDGVADPPLEGPERFLVRLSLGQLLVVIRAAVAVAVPDLADRGHVDRVVDAPVATQRQPVDFPVPGGHLDRGGAVIGGEVIAAGEAGHVGHVTDDGAGDHGADAEDLREGGAGGLDRGGQLLAGVAQLGVEVAQVGQELSGELGAGLGDGTGRRDPLQDPGSLSCGDLLRATAGDQVAQHGVQPAGGSASCTNWPRRARSWPASTTTSLPPG
jgi:hypothetical protein